MDETQFADPKAMETDEKVEAGNEVDPTAPLLPMRRDEQALLDGAAATTQGANAHRDQLLLRISQLEQQVAVANDERDQFLKEKNEATKEVESLKKAARIKRKKADAAEQQRLACQSALVAAFRGDDVVDVRAWRNGLVSDEIRKTIRSGSRLHPDYTCVECGRRRMGLTFPTEKHLMGKFAEMTFDTLRECAALCDMREEWKAMDLLDAHLAMRERADKKEVSYNALKKAYRAGICVHALPDVDTVTQHGVNVEGEEPSVSDALSEVLMRSGGRKTRRPCVVLAPNDSVLCVLKGSFREIEEMKYENEVDLKTLLQGMEAAQSFPKSLFLLVKSSFCDRILLELRAYLDKMSKNNDLTCYVAADILPSKPKEIKIELVKTQQQWLTEWKKEACTQSNLMLISQFSGMLWKICPFVSIFMVSQTESKDLLEKAIKHLVDGTPFPLELAVKKPDPPMKRSFQEARPDRRSEGQGPPKEKKRFVRKCYNCGSTDHISPACDKPDRRLE